MLDPPFFATYLSLVYMEYSVLLAAEGPFVMSFAHSQPDGGGCALLAQMPVEEKVAQLCKTTYDRSADKTSLTCVIEIYGLDKKNNEKTDQ